MGTWGVTALKLPTKQELTNLENKLINEKFVIQRALKIQTFALLINMTNFHFLKKLKHIKNQYH